MNNNTDTNHQSPLISRRSALGSFANGLGALTLTSMLQDELVGAPRAIDAQSSLHTARAKRVIYLWMNGGPSQIDTFDPKPDINKLAKEKENVTEAPFKFARYGESGTEVSELLPHIAKQVDNLCVVRSMKGETNTHEHAITFTMTGVPQNNTPVPTIGNWVVYGLGCESQDLPALISIGPSHPNVAEPYFLPAWTGGVNLNVGEKKKDDEPLIPNLANDWLQRSKQRKQLDLIQKFNRWHLETRPGESRLNARIESFERAFRMQVEATDAFDISGEAQHTKDAYGIGQTETDEYARRCIIARRMAERGVRFTVVPFSPAPNRTSWPVCTVGTPTNRTIS